MSDATDTEQVVHALRAYAKREWGFGSHVPHLMDEAADALERLAAENAELREDAERLISVTSHGWRVTHTVLGWCVFDRHGRAINPDPRPTYGSAIDAAMAEGNGDVYV